MIKHPVLRYYGGKWNLAPWIISFFPHHLTYIEPCGGAASVLIRKHPSKLEIYNDLDSYVVNFFRVLRDKPDELIRKIELTPWSREEYELSKIPEGDDVELARRFFSCCWMSISGTPFSRATGWRSTSYAGQSFSKVSRCKINTQKELYKVAERFSEVQLEHRDARYVIERYGKHDGALVYFDPPYLQSTRTSGVQYLLEVDEDFHIECAELLYECEYVVVSGYASDLYRDLYSEWHQITKESQTNSGSKRMEWLWVSPQTWDALNKNKIEQGVLF